MSLDPQKFKAAQRKGWDSVAEGWKKWWKIIEVGGQVVSNRLIELAEIRPGNRVLDVATGIGEPAVTAARKVGPSGKVTAIDLSPAMLSIARERAKQSGLSDIIEFQEADAESLGLPPSSFDAIVCRFGLMFMPDLVSALKTMRGLLAPNGRIAAAVWSSMDRVPAFLIPFEIVSRETGTPPPPPGSPGPFSLADTSLLRKKFEQAGFNDIKIESSKMDFKLPSPEEYVDFVRSTAAPLGAMMAGLPAARQEEIWNKVAETARRDAVDSSTGAVRFTNEVIFVSARS
ncbi:MAG: methyltransferase domain-containing protein [Nitrososphaera sp.]|jgi:ubiquinone/menaquinone biosynthesis C-methylase UbiE